MRIGAFVKCNQHRHRIINGLTITIKIIELSSGYTGFSLDYPHGMDLSVPAVKVKGSISTIMNYVPV